MWATRIVPPIAVIMAAASVIATPAHATPGRDVQATELWKRTADAMDYTFEEITIAPGGSTGWHWHTGRLYGVIKEGTLTHYMADCSVDGVYSAGDAVFEQSGQDRVHIGRNEGGAPLVLQVLYVLPARSALSEDAPDPGCGFA